MGASVVRNEVEGCKVKTGDSAIEFSETISSIVGFLHHNHGSEVSGLHLLLVCDFCC